MQFYLFLCLHATKLLNLQYDCIVLFLYMIFCIFSFLLLTFDFSGSFSNFLCIVADRDDVIKFYYFFPCVPNRNLYAFFLNKSSKFLLFLIFPLALPEIIIFIIIIKLVLYSGKLNNNN